MSIDSYNLFIKSLNKSNTQIIRELVSNGDSLVDPHLLDHFASFNSRHGCMSFLKVAYSRGFTGSNSFNYQRNCWEVHFSRADIVNENTIDDLIEHIERFVKDFQGQYDGWFTLEQ
ncbi:ribonuclease E inhibitor RraB [Candidatus Enterococcus ferrettii]|uniref:Regulator of ribonuclease activity B domain-containing protein n=1 Tax=Candidatus Enterococcus ferrettii TaxID=2815324 RepID=A0ABV0EX43_9ENTE|nr:ribonuclease E inhibitor RraB [Enterococcus sp. 665A]